MKTYQVEVTLSKQEDGLWRAEVPALPGCFVDADTLEQALTDIQAVAEMFIVSYRKHGDPLPPELSVVTDDVPQSLTLLVSVR